METFPSVLILGARQVGKTTLARQTFPELPYCDLEEPRTRALFHEDPTFQLASRVQRGLILDEAQSVPEVFASLRGLIDEERRENGRFLLLGSASPALVRGVSETLAGRVGILELDPLTAAEVTPAAWDEIWLKGGFPDALRGDFQEWWESYLRTYLERDLPQLGVGADPLLLRRLVTMLAHRQGGLLNLSELAASLAVSQKTVGRYLDILEQTYLVRRLTPYSKNLGKRLVRSPKIYLRDTGLLHHLLGIQTMAQLREHPALGASWESFVLEDLARREKLAHPRSQFFFWRTAAGAECDLVIERGSRLMALEIKTGNGYRNLTHRSLGQIVTDLEASTGWILDQAPGIDRLSPLVTRRPYPESLDWLP